MGYYINQTSNGGTLEPRNKAQQLIADGAVQIDTPKAWVENLVCVVVNPYFDAAAYIYSPDEFKEFKDTTDYRPKAWLIYEHAERLSGYKNQIS